MTKGLKTFNLRHSTIAIVKKKPNQSEFVDRAIIQLHKKQEEFDISDVRTRQLIAALHQREDCPKHIRLLLWDELCK